MTRLEILALALALATGLWGCGADDSPAGSGNQTGDSGTGGRSNVVPVGNCGIGCANETSGSCATPEIRITEVDVGVTVQSNESETEFMPLAIAPLPSGGSRVAWMSDDDRVYVATLDCNDQLIGTPFSLPAHDFQDLGADDDGGVLMLTRDAQGGGTLNCGNPTNLCDNGPNPPIPCYDMYLARFDCAGSEIWTTKLTTSSADLPPYSTGPTGDNVFMVWWYQHHGRLAFDGSNYAAYFCDAITVSEGGCINIHQGDRMQVVGSDGSLLDGHDSFDVGCSHSGFTRIVWDPMAGHFVMVCKTDNNNRIALPNPYRTILPVDLAASSVGNVVLASGGGYWLTASNQSQVHLLHFTDGAADQDLVLASADHPHLASYGTSRLLAGWDTGSGLVVQVRDAADGSAVSAELPVAVPPNRYQAFKGFPDGSVAYAAPGTTGTGIRIARALPCSD